MQKLKEWSSIQYPKESRLKQEKMKMVPIQNIPFCSFFINFMVFSPFILLGFIFIMGPYMIDDYVINSCILDKSIPIDNQEKSYFYQKLTLNYTKSSLLQGVQKTCISSNLENRNACSRKIPSKFECLVGYYYDGKGDIQENEILDVEGYSKKNTLNSIGFLIIFMLLYGIFAFIYIFYKIINFFLDKYLLEKITDEEYGWNKFQNGEHQIQYDEGVNDHFKLIQNPKVLRQLSKTAYEKDERIQWCFQPPLFKLIKNSSWMIGIYIFLGVLPILFILIYYGIYFGYKFPWKMWGLIVYESSIIYVFILYIISIIFYIYTSNRTYLFITSSRSIYIISCSFIYWIFEFPHSDIQKFEPSEETQGPFIIQSKQYNCNIELFPYVDDINYVKSILEPKLTIEPKIETFENEDIKEEVINPSEDLNNDQIQDDPNELLLK